MSQGSLVSKIHTANSILPISGAKVSVFQGENLIKEQYTDDSGITSPTVIDTPEESLSQSPGNQSPFSTVDILIEKKGYYIVRVNNVQVFSNWISYNDFSLIPLPEFENKNKNEITINVNKQNL